MNCMLSIILPTYNEAENLPELIERIETALKGHLFEIIVVDDNSPDGTADVAVELNRKYGNIRVLRRRGKLGLASAILDGVNMANGNVIVVMDADLQHPPELLPRLVEKMEEGYHVVIASRYVNGGGVEGWSFWRKLISKGAIFLAHLLLPETRKVKDVTSGYFVLKKDVLEGVRLNPVGYKLLLEVLVKGRYSKVVEVPYIFKPRKKGKSKLGFNEIFNYAFLLLKLRVGK